ncbi:MAG: hypothetical protein EHM40_06355 [Chloroflexi bacterium]|nr:MAG: hypothetical protein EHM40_06355 [Chloroflexota bacterium]
MNCTTSEAVLRTSEAVLRTSAAVLWTSAAVLWTSAAVLWTSAARRPYGRQCGRVKSIRVISIRGYPSDPYCGR